MGTAKDESAQAFFRQSLSFWEMIAGCSFLPGIYVCIDKRRADASTAGTARRNKGLMKKIAAILVFLAVVCACMGALAQEILYTATVTKDMTMRQKKSTSAKKVGSVDEAEEILIIDYGA